MSFPIAVGGFSIPIINKVPPAPYKAFVSLSLLYWALQSFSQLLSIKKKAD